MAAAPRLKLSRELHSFIRHLHPDLKRKVRATFEEILRDPSAGKALRDDLTGLKSFRVGKIRIIYRSSSRHIEVVALGPRRQIYADTLRLLKRDHTKAT